MVHFLVGKIYWRLFFIIIIPIAYLFPITSFFFSFPDLVSSLEEPSAVCMQDGIYDDFEESRHTHMRLESYYTDVKV